MKILSRVGLRVVNRKSHNVCLCGLLCPEFCLRQQGCPSPPDAGNVTHRKDSFPASRETEKKSKSVPLVLIVSSVTLI